MRILSLVGVFFLLLDFSLGHSSRVSPLIPAVTVVASASSLVCAAFAMIRMRRVLPWTLSGWVAAALLCLAVSVLLPRLNI